MVEIHDRNGRVIHCGRNLRAVFDHARRTWIEEALACPTENGKGMLQVTFGDGYTCRTEFASFEVLSYWLKRRRSWAGVRRIAGSHPF